MNLPTSPIPDELLSAYLDGELSAAEQAQVEAALQGDGRLQATLSELRRIRAAIRSLPRHQLPSEFSDRILELCQAGANRVASKPSSVPSRRRRIMVALFATAASLALTVWAVDRGWWSANSGGPRSVALHQPDAEDQPDAADQADGIAENPLRARALQTQDEPAPVRAFSDADMESTMPPLLAVEPDGVSAEDAEMAPPAEPRMRSTSPVRLAGVGPTSEQTLTPLAAQVELALPTREIVQLKQRIQAQPAKRPGLQVTDLADQLARTTPADPMGRSLEQLRDWYESQPAESVEVLLMEGTQEQIAFAVSDIEVAAAPVTLLRSDFRASQFGFARAAAAESPGLGGFKGSQNARETRFSYQLSEALTVDAPAEEMSEQARRNLTETNVAPTARTQAENEKLHRFSADALDSSVADKMAPGADAQPEAARLESATLGKSLDPSLAPPAAAASQPSLELERAEAAVKQAPRYRILFLLKREASDTNDNR